MVLFREAAGHMIQASTACTWMGSAMPNSSIGISSVIPRSGVGKQKQYTRLGTVGKSRPRRGMQSSTNWSWRPWGVELMAGVIAPPRSVVSRLIGLTAWFARNPTKRRHTAEILGGRWVRCFQFRKEVSSLFVHYWDWLHSQGSVSRGRAIIVPRGVLEDLLLALCHLMLFDLRLRTSPWSWPAMHQLQGSEFVAPRLWSPKAWWLWRHCKKATTFAVKKLV